MNVFFVSKCVFPSWAAPSATRGVTPRWRTPISKSVDLSERGPTGHRLCMADPLPCYMSHHDLRVAHPSSGSPPPPQTALIPHARPPPQVAPSGRAVWMRETSNSATWTGRSLQADASPLHDMSGLLGTKNGPEYHLSGLEADARPPEQHTHLRIHITRRNPMPNSFLPSTHQVG